MKIKVSIYTAEQRAMLDCDVSEALRAADLSLVAPIPPSPGLLQVFLHAINDALPGNFVFFVHT